MVEVVAAAAAGGGAAASSSNSSGSSSSSSSSSSCSTSCCSSSRIPVVVAVAVVVLQLSPKPPVFVFLLSQDNEHCIVTDVPRCHRHRGRLSAAAAPLCGTERPARALHAVPALREQGATPQRGRRSVPATCADGRRALWRRWSVSAAGGHSDGVGIPHTRAGCWRGRGR